MNKQATITVKLDQADAKVLKTLLEDKVLYTTPRQSLVRRQWAQNIINQLGLEAN